MSGEPVEPRSRIVLATVLVVVIVLGLGSRRFGEFLPDFLAANAGDALWTMAVYLVLAVLAPGWPPLKLGLFAFGISLAVESSQLLDTPWLNAIRNTIPGRLLLGAGFLWIDLLRYSIGALASTALDRLLLKPRRLPTSAR